jgi:hypothetical protein
MSTRIPAHLLDPAQKLQFLTWLCNIPLWLNVKHRLAREWCDATRQRLDAIDYTAIHNSRIPRNG